MKFIFSDSLDFVDPEYDFVADRSSPEREPYWDDHFPHELLGYAPYDGMLVSRATVGGREGGGKYSESQAMRFHRVGAREFLRFHENDYPNSLMFGDCGAFSYHKLEHPPHTSDDIVDFYGDGQFTHGCSIDHVIFDFDNNDDDLQLDESRLKENRRRFEITSDNAEEFLKKSKRLGSRFTPLGVIQGWSAASMAKAAKRLEKMGYNYLAVGGMVPLQSPQIKKVLEQIRKSVRSDMKLHLLGFAKAEDISTFKYLNVSSFDTTSPLIRAFKDSSRNYFTNSKNGLDYYSAIRVPQATENSGLLRLAKQGIYDQEDLQLREHHALTALRAYDKSEVEIEETLNAVMNYTAPIAIGRDDDHSPNELKKLKNLKLRYHRTLKDKPWTKCGCPVCKQAGIEIIIFRANNRNKRRGIHNLHAYRSHIRDIAGIC